MISQLRVGPINSIQDTQRALSDVQLFADSVFQTFQAMANKPGAGDLRLLVEEEDGLAHIWELVAGAGVTISFDAVNRQCTISSP